VSRPTFAAPTGYAGAQAISTAQLLGQVLFLVAIALGFLAVGTLAGQDLASGTALMCSLAGFGMLLAQAFVRPLRTGPLGMGWLFSLALLIGLGLGPTLAEYAAADPTAVTNAAASTALVVAGCGATGFLLSKDLARWMKPLTLVVLGLVAVSFVMVVIGSSSPMLSLAIGGVSALLIVVDFNYLRKHGTADDAIWLATGIFVSIVNIFLSLLQLFGND
jgi:modulator of FtsH protease